MHIGKLLTPSESFQSIAIPRQKKGVWIRHAGREQELLPWIDLRNRCEPFQKLLISNFLNIFDGIKKFAYTLYCFLVSVLG